MLITGLVEAILTAYRERIDRLDWMSEPTKDKAREKLARVKAKVGYPDHWKDYSTLVVRTNLYGENMMQAALAFSGNDFLVRQAGGPHGMGHDAAAIQCLLR